VAAPGVAVVDPGPVFTGLRVVVGSLRGATEVFADRTISVARVDSGRGILFCSTPGDREHRFSIRFREPTAADFGSAFGAGHDVEPLYPVSFLRLLSGSGVSRNFAVGTGSPMGNIHRHFNREYYLHLWPVALELLFSSKRRRNPDVLIDLRDRSFFRHSVQEIRESLDGSGHPRHW